MHQPSAICLAVIALLAAAPSGCGSSSAPPAAAGLGILTLPDPGPAGPNARPPLREGSGQSLATSFAASGTEQGAEQRGAAEQSCPSGMIHVVGEFCPDVRQHCRRWLDPPGSRYADYRCAEYARSECAGARRHADYCIDRDEYAPAGSDLPASEQSWTDANATCARLGKRLCLQSEWEFACEGEEMRPYPYGYTRDSTACNADLTDIYEQGGARIKDLRAKHGAHPACTSPFGVRDLSGNLEEFVSIDGSSPPRPALMGAWWQPSRNHCRARQTAHNRYYKGRETGFRCCADAGTAGALPPSAEPL